MDGGSEGKRLTDRYVVYDEIASGGMASVHIGRLIGPAGFSRTVAIKALHAQYAKDPEFVAMFLDEARLAARIRHPNVVSTVDVVAQNKELFLVMEYVQGETLARLVRLSAKRQEPVPLGVVSAVLADVLDGLHAAHEATDERGDHLAIVHRDVSPHNVMVGRDGIARVLDFGIAKAASRVQTTRDGQVKGKFAYMAPEQIMRHRVDRRTDVFAASIVLWEALTGTRLFAADEPAAVVASVIGDSIAAPSTVRPEVSREVDEIVLRGLARDRDSRFATAHDMARALEHALPPARRTEITTWVEAVAGEALSARAGRIAEIESNSSSNQGAGRPRPALPTAPTLQVSPAPGIEATQATDLSSTGPKPKAPPTRRAWPYVGAATAVGAALWFGASHRAANTTAEAPAALPAPATSSLPSPPSSSPPSATADPTPPPAASPPPSATIIARPSPPPSPLPARPAAHPHAKPGCSPPYVIDETGLKHFKPICL